MKSINGKWIKYINLEGLYGGINKKVSMECN